MDTSFAGSAMRTTGMLRFSLVSTSEINDQYILEGVWMSITPTDEALLVALDFEGMVLPFC